MKTLKEEGSLHNTKLSNGGNSAMGNIAANKPYKYGNGGVGEMNKILLWIIQTKMEGVSPH